MKPNLKTISIALLGVFLLIGFTTQLFSNLYRLIGDGYIIPKESSISSFKPTMMNFGREYWLYGEDDTNYYTTLLNKEAGYTAKYALISKEKSRKIPNFNKHHYTTWFKVNFKCGDILKKYAQKPKQLEFVKCESVENSQAIVRATYRIKGHKSKEVEDFLVENYGMGRLKWVCCGWETGGKQGGFEHPEFKNIHPFLTASISMWASAEIEDENDPTKVELAIDRNKIDYFYVIVELVIV